MRLSACVDSGEGQGWSVSEWIAFEGVTGWLREARHTETFCQE